MPAVVDTGARVVPDQQHRGRKRDRRRIGRADEPALDARREPSAWISEDDMGERRAEPDLPEDERRCEEPRVVAVLQLALEQGVADEGHQDADTVLRSTSPGDQARGHERPGDRDARNRVLRRRVQVVDEDAVPHDPERNRRNGERRAQRFHRVLPTTARRDSSDSRSLGMKPRTRLLASRGP